MSCWRRLATRQRLTVYPRAKPLKKSTVVPLPTDPFEAGIAGYDI
jgi:hypothetical protein